MDISTIDFGRILKWVLIVLITGFIAQFGKSFAKYIMEKIRRGKTLEGQEPDSLDDGRAPLRPTLSPERDTAKGEKPEAVTDTAPLEEKDQAKLRKKALKAQVKEQKKKKI
ncbi:hypothetical protein SAMN04489760_104139 [Syntrophus gentianae]|uniref:Uncharacterized protein n=1 Tax=Syntrophus gentianae TaxID=43775 RepID=A0A1H7VRN2_9BACT|nr:hypothetical protein [Syntrophus gentianae]SEM11704.1 hypothetical protein SAMN04489760_104139 [Syntrophus gentianae]